MRAARFAVLLIAAAGCNSAPPPEATGGGAAPAASSAEAVPTEHLAPDELVEGTQDAYGIKLPRGMDVTGRLNDRVFATGYFQVHPLVQYFRARLQDGELREGKESATFEHVKVPGKPGVELAIRVTPATTGGMDVTVMDTTKPPAPDLPNEEARWKAVGLTKDGKVLDPKHLD